MKKERQVKAGTVIEAGTQHQMITGKVRVVLPEQGLGKRTLYKCVFLSPVSVRNEDDTMSKSKTTHMLYRNQFEVLDF
jgi:hypothetical protein